RNWLTLGDVRSPPAAAARYYSRGWGRGGMHASTRARDRLGLSFIRRPCRQYKSSRRSDLGGRKPVPILQADARFRAARGRVQRGARRSIASAPGAHHLAHRTGAQRPRLPRCFAPPTAARRPPASAISKAASAGRLRRWARPAMRATAVRAAILRAASADIPGARREKTTFYPTRTRSRSGSRPNSLAA